MSGFRFPLRRWLKRRGRSPGSLTSEERDGNKTLSKTHGDMSVQCFIELESLILAQIERWRRA